jgi:hypothetical protein
MAFIFFVDKDNKLQLDYGGVPYDQDEIFVEPTPGAAEELFKLYRQGVDTSLVPWVVAKSRLTVDLPGIGKTNVWFALNGPKREFGLVIAGKILNGKNFYWETGYLLLPEYHPYNNGEIFLPNFRQFYPGITPETDLGTIRRLLIKTLALSI